MNIDTSTGTGILQISLFGYSGKAIVFPLNDHKKIFNSSLIAQFDTTEILQHSEGSFLEVSQTSDSQKILLNLNDAGQNGCWSFVMLLWEGTFSNKTGGVLEALSNGKPLQRKVIPNTHSKISVNVFELFSVSYNQNIKKWSFQTTFQASKLNIMDSLIHYGMKKIGNEDFDADPLNKPGPSIQFTPAQKAPPISDPKPQENQLSNERQKTAQPKSQTNTVPNPKEQSVTNPAQPKTDAPKTYVMPIPLGIKQLLVIGLNEQQKAFNTEYVIISGWDDKNGEESHGFYLQDRNIFINPQQCGNNGIYTIRLYCGIEDEHRGASTTIEFLENKTSILKYEYNNPKEENILLVNPVSVKFSPTNGYWEVDQKINAMSNSIIDELLSLGYVEENNEFFVKPTVSKSFRCKSDLYVSGRPLIQENEEQLIGGSFEDSRNFFTNTPIFTTKEVYIFSKVDESTLRYHSPHLGTDIDAIPLRQNKYDRYLHSYPQKYLPDLDGQQEELEEHVIVQDIFSQIHLRVRS